MSSAPMTTRAQVPVPEDTRGKNIDLEVHVKRLSLRLNGRPILEGSLADVVRLHLPVPHL